MDGFIHGIAGNATLQAVSTVVAVITALYYALKGLLLGGRWFWSRVSPPLGKLANQITSNMAETYERATRDAIYLITLVARRACVIFFFYMLYAVTLYDLAIQPSASAWTPWTIGAKYVFLLAGSWNLGNLYAQLKHVARSRARMLKDGGQ